jgi:hypothetical protein
VEVTSKEETAAIGLSYYNQSTLGDGVIRAIARI